MTDPVESMRRKRGPAAERLQAAGRSPDFGDAHNNLGMVLRDAPRVTKALTQFERVVREHPGMAAARLNLALTLSLLGRMPEATAHYQEARRLNSALPEFRP